MSRWVERIVAGGGLLSALAVVSVGGGLTMFCFGFAGLHWFELAGGETNQRIAAGVFSLTFGVAAASCAGMLLEHCCNRPATP